jgi:hypothetical protein
MVNDHFDFEDIRTDEPIEDNRQRDFFRGWNRAADGREYDGSLDNLSWRALGWRPGMVFREQIGKR